MDDSTTAAASPVEREVSAEMRKMVDAFGDASFDCGAHDRGDSDDAWADIAKWHDRASTALLTAISKLESERDEWERKSKNNGLAAAIAMERNAELESENAALREALADVYERCQEGIETGETER